jgi:hypothetical protein
VASFNKLAGFVEHLATKVHNLGADALTYALTNTAPGSESTPPTDTAAHCVLANITQIAYTNLSSRVPTITSCTQSGGTLKLILGDLTLTSSGGATGPFRYVYLYNDTPTSPADPLIGYYDYGSSITLNSTETLLIDNDGTNGVLQIA